MADGDHAGAERLGRPREGRARRRPRPSAASSAARTSSAASARCSRRRPSATARVLTIRGDHGVGKTRLLYEVERRLRKGGYNVGFHVAACPPRGDEFPLSGIVCMLQVLCGTAEGDAQRPHPRRAAAPSRARPAGRRGERRAHRARRDRPVVLAATRRRCSATPSRAWCRASARTARTPSPGTPRTRWTRTASRSSSEVLAAAQARARRLRLRGARRVLAPAREARRARRARSRRPGAGRRRAPRRAAPRRRRACPTSSCASCARAPAGTRCSSRRSSRASSTRGAVTVAERHVVAMKLVGQDLALPKTLRGLVASRVARLVGRRPRDAPGRRRPGRSDRRRRCSRACSGSRCRRSSARSRRSRSATSSCTPGPSELRFASPIIPEIVADALTPEAAREMHAAAGQALETTLGERAWEHAARIAGHLYEAGDRERAAGYFAKSGERRLETRQLEAAARDYARAIALADPAKRDARGARGVARGARVGRAPRALAARRGRALRPRDRAGRPGGRPRGPRAGARRGGAASSRRRSTWKSRASGSPRPRPSPRRTSSCSSRCSSREAELATRQGDFKRALGAPRAAPARSSRALERRPARSTASRCSSRRRTRAWATGRTALASLREAEQLLPDDRMAAARAHEGARARRLLHARLPVRRAAQRAGPSTRRASWVSPTRSCSTCTTSATFLVHARRPSARLRRASASRSRSARRAATSGSRTTTACSSRSSTASRARVDGEKLLRQGHRLRREQATSPGTSSAGASSSRSCLHRGGQSRGGARGVREDARAGDCGGPPLRHRRLRSRASEAGTSRVSRGSALEATSIHPSATSAPLRFPNRRLL